MALTFSQGHERIIVVEIIVAVISFHCWSYSIVVVVVVTGFRNRRCYLRRDAIDTTHDSEIARLHDDRAIF